MLVVPQATAAVASAPTWRSGRGRNSQRRRLGPLAAAGSTPPPEFKRSDSQQKIADFDKAVSDAQAAAGDALLNALGPLADMLRLRPTAGKKSAIASGQVSKWAATKEVLDAARLASVTPAQAQELMGRGWVLLDVSPAEDYEAYHAKGAVSAPTLRYVQPAAGGSDLRSMLRGVALASLSVRPTEDDWPGFAEKALAALKGSAAGVIVACAAGGMLRKTINFPMGQASRSLFAAEALLTNAGLDAQRVVHLRGGLAAWFADGLPGEGDEDAWEARKGRTPSVGGPMYEQDAPELQ